MTTSVLIVTRSEAGSDAAAAAAEAPWAIAAAAAGAGATVTDARLAATAPEAAWTAGAGLGAHMDAWPFTTCHRSHSISSDIEKTTSSKVRRISFMERDSWVRV